MPKQNQPLSKSQKTKMQQALMEATIVRSYLEILRERPGPGRRRSKETIELRISAIEVALEEAATMDTIRLLEITQEKLNLEAELEVVYETRAERLADAEERFIAVCASFTERKGLTYQAWRAVGVPAAVLKKAGIPATRVGPLIR
jgi:hypothetical protein